MQLKTLILLSIFSLGIMHGCQKDEETSDLDGAGPGDQLGATCYSYPYLTPPESETKYNLCRQPGTTFYGGWTAAFAKRLAIENCQELNALDNGHKAGPGQSCYNVCFNATYCLPYTSQ